MRAFFAQNARKTGRGKSVYPLFRSMGHPLMLGVPSELMVEYRLQHV